MTPTFHVKNFERFQHYKDRSPPWIKLYNELLDDYQFGCLQDASKMHLIAIWLLASRSDNELPFDPEWIARRINATEKVDLHVLLDAGFIVLDQPLPTLEQDASTSLAKRLPREREEGEAEGEAESSLRSLTRANSFDAWWSIWPHKVGIAAARKAYAKALKLTDHDTLVAEAQRYAETKPASREWCNPATWLNQERWLDEPAESGGDAIDQAIDWLAKQQNGQPDERNHEDRDMHAEPGEGSGPANLELLPSARGW